MSIKVQVAGTSAAAEILREHLRCLDYVVTERGGRYSVHMDANRTGGPNLACDEFAGDGWGIEMEGAGEFGDEARRAVAELSGVPVCWRNSESSNTNQLHVAVPANEQGSVVWEDAAARGVLRAILKLTRHGEPGWPGQQNWLNVQGWWNKLKGKNEK